MSEKERAKRKKAAMPPRISSAKFSWENGAERNGVFLWENHDEPPFLRPVEGWEIIGYTKSAPWPGISKGFAVMLEKAAPAEEESRSMFIRKNHRTFDEGTRIWQHICEDNFKRIVQARAILERGEKHSVD